jgi:membrane-bound serine protease (ClpP class)
LLGLAFVGLGLLPVNWFGVGLIVFAGALMYFEVQVSGVGAFGVGAVLCFALGGLMLFGGIVPSPEGPWQEAHVSRWLIVGMTAFFGSVLAFFVFMLKEGGSSTGYPSATHGGLVGAFGTVMSDLDPAGEIRVGEAEWTATTDTGSLITKGTEVEVVGDYVGGVVKVITRRDSGEMQAIVGWLDRLRGRWRR